MNRLDVYGWFFNDTSLKEERMVHGKDRSLKKLEKNKRFKRNQKMRKGRRIDARTRRG